MTAREPARIPPGLRWTRWWPLWWLVRRWDRERIDTQATLDWLGSVKAQDGHSEFVSDPVFHVRSCRALGPTHPCDGRYGCYVIADGSPVASRRGGDLDGPV